MADDILPTAAATVANTTSRSLGWDLAAIARDAKSGTGDRIWSPAYSQFERLGYFFTDPVDSKPGKPVFNRTSTLRDTWAKESAKD